MHMVIEMVENAGPWLHGLAPADKSGRDADHAPKGPPFYHSCTWTDLRLETTSSEFTYSTFHVSWESQKTWTGQASDWLSKAHLFPSLLRIFSCHQRMITSLLPQSNLLPSWNHHMPKIMPPKCAAWSNTLHPATMPHALQDCLFFLTQKFQISNLKKSGVSKVVFQEAKDGTRSHLKGFGHCICFWWV